MNRSTTSAAGDLSVDLKAEAVRRLARRRAAEVDPAALAPAVGADEQAAKAVFPGQDDLLTALVLDAYNAMSDAAESSASEAYARGADLLDRWVAICLGVRSWALAHRDEYALIWGQPVPGYTAPPETMAAGARTVRALLAVVRDADAAGRLHAGTAEFDAGMSSNVAALAEGLLAGVPEPVIARMLVIWTQLHGMVGFEANGHIAGVAADPAAYFTYAAREMGRYLGIS